MSDWSPVGREGKVVAVHNAVRHCVLAIVCGIVRGNVWYGLTVSVSITMTDKGRYIELLGQLKYCKI